MNTATLDPIRPDAVLAALATRRGAANGITARDLAFVLTGRVCAADERRLRTAIEHLRRQGEPICAHPSTGYHLAANPSEMDRTCEFLLGRAMSSLEQISAIKRVALPDLRGQLHMPLPDTSHPEATTDDHADR
jgi:hypothetical protein